MTPFDPRLTVIATQARVKTCHVFHMFCAMKEMGKRFHAEAFAQFAGLEVRHVEAILSSLQEHDCMPTKASRTETTKGTRLPDDWTIPEEWLDWASKEKRWHPADARAESDIFANYWQARSGTGAAKLDWRKVWMNWVKNSRRPNGDYVAAAPKMAPKDRAEWLRGSIAFYNKMGRETETVKWKRELAEIEGNVLPFERKAG